MDLPAIATIASTSEDRVREEIHNVNADGFDALAPTYAGGRPPKFTLPERQAIKEIAPSRPRDHHLPCSIWSLSKLSEFLVAEGVVDDTSHEGLRVLLREESVSAQVIKTWKPSTEPDVEAEEDRILEFDAIADGTRDPLDGDPSVVTCLVSSVPSTSSPTPASSGLRSRRPRDQPRSPDAVAGVPLTPAPTASATSWPATTCRPTTSTGT